MLDCRAATLDTVSPPLRDSYPATIMPLPRCRIPILTVAGLIEIAAPQHTAALSGKRLLALWNTLPGVEKRRKVGATA